MNATAEFGAPLILVLHRDAVVGLMIEELLLEAGAGSAIVAPSPAAAAHALGSGKVSAALLGIYIDHDEIVEAAEVLRRDGIPFVVWGALTELPTRHGIHLAPKLSALAEPHEIAAAFATIGVPFTTPVMP